MLHIRILEFTSQLQLLIPIPAKAGLWESGLDHIPGSQLLPSSATEGIWGANQKEGVLSHTHPFCFCSFLCSSLTQEKTNKTNNLSYHSQLFRMLLGSNSLIYCMTYPMH